MIIYHDFNPNISANTCQDKTSQTDPSKGNGDAYVWAHGLLDQRYNEVRNAPLDTCRNGFNLAIFDLGIALSISQETGSDLNLSEVVVRLFEVANYRELGISKTEIQNSLIKEITSELYHRVKQLNTRHAVVRMGSKTMILDEQPNQPAIFMQMEDFHRWYANNLYEDKVNDTKKKVSVSQLWMQSPERRQYERVVFDPTDTNPNHYNLWRGFTVQPDASKSCSKFLAHVKNNICLGNEQHYQWVLGFLAHMVQHPQEKPGVALVLRGAEGTGKGFFANIIGRLVAQEHFVVVSQSAHLTGRFNAHHQSALLIFVDEGFWAGDKAGEGALKHLVTDKELLIEGKFKDAFMVKNLSRLIIVSNEHWVVPAGTQARRWCVLDVADTHANDRKYFGEIAAEMDDGGLVGLMHVLTTFNLSSIDIHTAPMTRALLDQKEESFTPYESWWLECLTLGEIRYETESGHISEGWPDEIKKDSLWYSYQLWIQKHNVRGRIWPSATLHKWLKPLLPGYQESRPRTGNRERVINLPDLEDCRTAFAAHLRQTPDWD
jgi:Family of unknown function (DUF5906)